MTPEREAERLLALTGGDELRALELLERQLNTLQTRAQVLMSLAGVVITVTGFSGRLIADTNTAAQVCIITGVGLVLASAIYVYATVMGLRWVTQETETHAVDTLTHIISRRNRRTLAYRYGGLLLCLGFALYCVAVAIMLLNPDMPLLPVR